MSAVACPLCGELRGGRYTHDGIEVCWPCLVRRTGVSPLPAAAPSDPRKSFRRELLARLDRVTPRERFYYIDSDIVVMVCPVCDGPLGVRFHGNAPRATLNCHRSCSEAEVAFVLGLEVRQ